jgi:uncharacterized RmlC-like cupin family protein
MGKVFQVPSEACTSGTGQTSGMNRFAALSGDTVGSRAIWMGETHVAPHVASGPHHPVESNAHSEEEAVVVIARTTPEAIVENLPEL